VKIRLLKESGVLWSVALLCVSCRSFSASGQKQAQDVPPAYQTAVPGIPVEKDWWRAFGDDQLSHLMDCALRGNLSIEQAAARLRQAEASAVKSGAARFPAFTGTAGAETKSAHSDGQKTVTSEEFSLGLAASYEIDLWGRVASGRRAALRTMDASRYDLETAATTIAAKTAVTYFYWQQQRARLAILTRQLEANRKMLSVVEKRFQTAQADAVDVLQQRQRLAASEAAIPPVQSAVSAAEHALAILAGEPPQTDLNLTVLPFAELPAMPEAGLPADLLSRRPDLQAAWARLEAADWNVRAAQADRLPAIKLTGSAAYGADKTDALFQNWVMNLAAGLSAPLIDGGSRRAESARTKAVADERVAAYREAVLNALGEVEDALASEVHQHELLEAVRRQSAAAQMTAEESFRRYTRGLNSYFEALSAETARQALEVTVLQAEYDLRANRVQLCRVLGGQSGVILNRQDENE
jgi:NodT family efflux transporter outer membrane factor (OMF) lipoprotein